MGTDQGDFRPLSFSTAALPERKRVAAWRDFFGPKLFGGEVEPVLQEPFCSELRMRALPGASLLSAVNSPARFSRAHAFLADGNDDFGLHINSEGGTLTHRGRETTCGPGEAMFVTLAEPGVMLAPRASRFLCLHIGRTVLAPLVVNPDDALLRRVEPRSEMLRYLLDYVRVALTDRALSNPDLAATAAAHLRDLFALMIGATRDAAHIAEGRGLRAARMQSIKRFIAENLCEHRLGVDQVASRHGISPRSVQRMFEDEGTTFSEYVLDQRLDAAYRALTDAQDRNRTVVQIALDAGFGDLSYFNRRFRRRYGAPPSWFRRRA